MGTLFPQQEARVVRAKALNKCCDVFTIRLNALKIRPWAHLLNAWAVENRQEYDCTVRKRGLEHSCFPR